MKEEIEKRLWSWVVCNFMIREEEKRGEIIATAYVIHEGIPDEERYRDLLPHATMVTCLVAACLHFLKEYRGADLRFACKNLVIEPYFVFKRFCMPVNYITPMGDISRKREDIWIDPKQSLDLDAQLIQIPPADVDAEINLNKHVLDFATKIFYKGIAVPRPAPNKDISDHFLQIAEESKIDHKVRFLALCLGATFSDKEYLTYRKRAGELLRQINDEFNHRNAAVNYYSMALSVPHPTEVV